MNFRLLVLTFLAFPAFLIAQESNNQPKVANKAEQKIISAVEQITQKAQELKKVSVTPDESNESGDQKSFRPASHQQ